MSGKSEIVAGTAHSGDPAVVYLRYAEGGLCTGTLIAPRVVLTARHCVERDGGEPMEPTHVGTGVTRSGGSTYAAVSGVRKISGGTWRDHDIALLILDSAGSLSPYPWGGVTPSIGDGIVGIGYGETDLSTGDQGTKRRGESSISEVSSTGFVTTGALGCYGDSGGPAFLGGRVVGVASTITTDTCSESMTIYLRVDAYRDFVQGVIDESEGALSGGSDPGGDPGTDPAPPSADDPSEVPGGGGTCMDTCPWAFDGECDDGGPGALYAECALGTDCADCGTRSGGTPPAGGGTGATCSETCTWSADGECDDGGPGSLYAVCPLGTDCTDCGAR